ncbi:MAG: tetratricopeptide repeat protein [Pseudomonadota bacterium]
MTIQSYLATNPAIGISIRSDGRYEIKNSEIAIPSDQEVQAILDATKSLKNKSPLLEQAWRRYGAQDNEDWHSAETCFRRAFDLAGGHYGYCLGTALNFLERCEESLPILQEQAVKHQPDAMSWFQVAVAHEKLGQTDQSIYAYRKAIELEPDYDLAWFNLGGVYWNDEKRDEAATIWKQAVAQFPDHELAEKLQSEISFIFR